MNRPLILRPEADDEIQKAHDYLEQVQSGLGVRFVSRVREQLAKIEMLPEAYGLLWHDVRAVRIKNSVCGLLCGIRRSDRGVGCNAWFTRCKGMAIASLIIQQCRLPASIGFAGSNVADDGFRVM